MIGRERERDLIHSDIAHSDYTETLVESRREEQRRNETREPDANCLQIHTFSCVPSRCIALLYDIERASLKKFRGFSFLIASSSSCKPFGSGAAFLPHLFTELGISEHCGDSASFFGITHHFVVYHSVSRFIQD